MPTIGKKSFKNMVIHSFLAREDRCEKPEFCFSARNLNEGQRYSKNPRIGTYNFASQPD